MPLTDPVHISPKYAYERGINLRNLTFGPPITNSNSLSPINFHIKSINQMGEIEYKVAPQISLADIYENQVNGWFFNIALDAFDNVGDAGFIVLMTALSFFEAHAQFLYGKDTNQGSKKYFKKCFKVVFPASSILGFSQTQSNKVANVFYDNLRCGLFHSAMIRKGIELNGNLNQPFIVSWSKNQKVNLVIVNPLLFLEAVQQYFHNYIQISKQDSNLQRNLEKGWSCLFDKSSEFIDELTAIEQYPSLQILPNKTFLQSQNDTTDIYTGGTTIYSNKRELP